jgi:hypothetical protein
MDSIYKKAFLDRINRIIGIYFFLGFQKKPRKLHPPAADTNKHYTEFKAK